MRDPPTRASSQSKESVGPPERGGRGIRGDGSEEEKTEERPSESWGRGTNMPKEPGSPRGWRAAGLQGKKCSVSLGRQR